MTKITGYFEAGYSKRQWYTKTYDGIEALFGEDTELFIKILAATSPVQSVTGNLTCALRALEIMRKGDVNTRYPFANVEDSLQANFMKSHSDNLIRVYHGEEIHGPKVLAFQRALLGDWDQIVIDRWMLRAYGYVATGHVTIAIKEHIERSIRRRVTRWNNHNLEQITASECQAAIWFGVKSELDTKPGRDNRPFEVQLGELL